MPPQPEDDTGSLEKARERLYEPAAAVPERLPLTTSETRALPHAWKEAILPSTLVGGKRHVRLASIFFAIAAFFFLISLAVVGYIFSVGGNTVSVDKIALDVQGPTTIAGGDVVPLSLTITNKNAVAIENATIEIAFPSGTRDAVNVLQAYPRYTENLGTLASGETITRTVKAVVFGGSGQALTLPVSLSYSAVGSNAVFVKKLSYAFTVSTTPLSVSIDALTETVSGQPFTLALTVRSNATVPLHNVVLAGTFPFGFLVTASSLPLNNSSFLLGTLSPGASKKVTLTGTLTGQDAEQRVFRFTLGTALTAQDQSLAVTYMTQDASVMIAAPFINTTLSLNGDTSPNVIVAPGAIQNVTLSYANTLSTSVTNASVVVKLSGSAVDYDSIRTSNGFYNSVDHTIVFSRDTDPALAQLAPGASGVGTFTFSTLPASARVLSPTILFTTSVSGTRIGQANVPEQVSASATKTAKVATNVALSASTRYAGAPVNTSGPIPPRAGQATTYAVVWNVHNGGSAVAGGTVTATLPSYVTYTSVSTGNGSFSYNDSSRTVSWNTGDLAQGATVQGVFQVSLLPSTSQTGSTPQLTGRASFAGFDRFAGIQVTAMADPVTTETKGDPDYNSANAVVQ